MARTTVEAQLTKLRKAKEALDKKEKALLRRSNGKIIAKIVQLATENGISAAQIADAMKAGKPKAAAEKPKAKRAAVAPKYRSPVNAEQTWTGRGKAPLWAKALKDAGTLEAALIQSAA